MLAATAPCGITSLQVGEAHGRARGAQAHTDMLGHEGGGVHMCTKRQHERHEMMQSSVIGETHGKCLGMLQVSSLCQ